MFFQQSAATISNANNCVNSLESRDNSNDFKSLLAGDLSDCTRGYLHQTEDSLGIASGFSMDTNTGSHNMLSPAGRFEVTIEQLNDTTVGYRATDEACESGVLE